VVARSLGNSGIFGMQSRPARRGVDVARLSNSKVIMMKKRCVDVMENSLRRRPRPRRTVQEAAAVNGRSHSKKASSEAGLPLSRLMRSWRKD
jgi:hypothetical protein